FSILPEDTSACRWDRLGIELPTFRLEDDHSTLSPQPPFTSPHKPASLPRSHVAYNFSQRHFTRKFRPHSSLIGQEPESVAETPGSIGSGRRQSEARRGFAAGRQRVPDRKLLTSGGADFHHEEPEVPAEEARSDHHTLPDNNRADRGLVPTVAPLRPFRHLPLRWRMIQLFAL
ncbi:unnamed protein product, partial [Pleuronectes platessa]